MNQKEELSKERILQAADQIVVLSEGKVAEAGSPADLYADEKSFPAYDTAAECKRRLWAAHFIWVMQSKLYLPGTTKLVIAGRI